MKRRLWTVAIIMLFLVILSFGIIYICIPNDLPKEQEVLQSKTIDLFPEEEEISQSPDKETVENKAEDKPSVLSEQEVLEQQVIDKLNSMTTEEKIAQLFIVTPEALTGIGNVIQAGSTTKTAINDYPVGGLIYFEGNIVSEEQVTAMTKLQQEYSLERIGLPLFMSIDEEGGTVARIGSNEGMNVQSLGNMAEIGATKELEKAYEAGDVIGTYLNRMGFNLNYAPVADVLTNSENTVVKKRSFGSDANLVSQMVEQQLLAFEKNQVYGCIKHFPGHGATSGDTHNGYSYTDKTWEELLCNELIPFQESIGKGISFIMVGHISAPKVTGDNIPTSLSKTMIQTRLREELNYSGIVLTDALNMKAITMEYNAAQAAIAAINAGVDMLVMPEDFHQAYEGVVEAVKNGTIVQERLDEAVCRILRVKLLMK